MLSDHELESMALAESDRVERKRNDGDVDKIRQAICAFANDLPGSGEPGVLFIGLEDDGSCAGLDIDDGLLLRLAAMRDDGAITPFPSLEVRAATVGRCPVAVVIVQPSRLLPVRFGGRVWIRVGPRRAAATPEEERRLAERQRHFDLPFDAREAASASENDLDVDFVRREYLPQAVAPQVLVENRRSLGDQLRALHLLGPTGAPTYAGLLVAGRDPQAWLPGAYVQFVRFDGRQVTDPVRDEKTVTGRIAEVITRTEEILEAHNQVGVAFAGKPREERLPEYPLAALQQIFRNAILHRSYEGTNSPCRIYWFNDRIEIFSPGGPFGRVNPSNFGQPYATDYRNQLLAEAMKNLGFAQRFGAGIAIAQRALADNGNPPIEFEVQPSAVLATLRRRP